MRWAAIAPIRISDMGDALFIALFAVLVTVLHALDVLGGLSIDELTALRWYV